MNEEYREWIEETEEAIREEQHIGSKCLLTEHGEGSERVVNLNVEKTRVSKYEWR